MRALTSVGLSNWEVDVGSFALGNGGCWAPGTSDDWRPVGHGGANGIWHACEVLVDGVVGQVDGGGGQKMLRPYRGALCSGNLLATSALQPCLACFSALQTDFSSRACSTFATF